MRTTRTLIPVLALAAIAIPAPAMAKPAADLPEVRRTATVDLTGNGWSGHLALGLATTGTATTRATRPMPLDLVLQRQSCDLGGCVTTTVSVAPGAVAMPRMASQFTSVGLDPVLVGVVVRRTAASGAAMEHTAVLSLSLRARRSGAVSKETLLRQGPAGETLTISLSVPLTGTVLLGDDTLVATGSAIKASVVR